MKRKVWDITVKDNPNRVVMGENDEFYTTDTEAYLVFNLDDKNFNPATAVLTLENRNDGSLKNETVDVVDGLIEWEMPQRYIEHFGNWQGQLVYEDTKDGQPELYTSAPFSFVVNAHIGDKKKPSLVEIENWEKFIREGTELIETWEDLEALREENERQRQENYQELLDTGVLQTNINTKLEQLEEEYAPKLTEVTAQLAQKVGGGNKAELEDLSSTVLSAIEGGEGTSFDLLSIPQDKSVTPKKTTFAAEVPTSVNLFNKENVTTGFRFKINTGEPYERADYSISEKYDVVPGETYVVTAGVRVVERDKDNIFLRAVTSINTAPSQWEYTVGENAVYMQHDVYIPHLDAFMLVKGSEMPSEYVPYTPPKIKISNLLLEDDDKTEVKKKFEGLKWNVLGDSITNRTNHSYWTILKDELGFSEVVNYGKSGSAIMKRADRSDDMATRYADMGEADVITLLGGTNDFGNSVELGEFSDRGADVSFYGACHTLISGLIEKYPTKIIAVFTTIPRYNMLETNSKGLYVHDYMDALREVAGFYGVPSFDILRNSQIRAYNETAKAAYIPDGLHPNDAGYDLMAAQMLPLMQGL